MSTINKQFSFQEQSLEIFDKIKAPNSFMHFIKLKTIDLTVLFYKNKYKVFDNQNFSEKQLSEILDKINNSESQKLQEFILLKIKDELFELTKIIINNYLQKNNIIENQIQSSDKISQTLKKFNFFKDQGFMEFIKNSISFTKLLIAKNSESKIGHILQIEEIFDNILEKTSNLQKLNNTLNQYTEIYIKSISNCNKEINNLNEIYKTHFINHEHNLETILILSLYESFFTDIICNLNAQPDQQKHKFFQIDNEKLKTLGILFGHYPNLDSGKITIDEFIELEAEKIFCFSKINYNKLLNNKDSDNRIKVFDFLINIFNSKKDFLEFIKNNGSRKISYIFNAINEDGKEIKSKITQSKILKICELSIDILEQIDFKFFIQIYSLKDILFGEANDLILSEKLLDLYELYKKDHGFLESFSYNQMKEILNSSESKIEFFKNYNQEVFFYEIKENLKYILELDDEKIQALNQFNDEIFQKIRSHKNIIKFSFKDLIHLSQEDLIFLNENILFFEKIINEDLGNKIFKNKSFKDISPNFYNHQYNIFYKLIILTLEMFQIQNIYNDNTNSFYLYNLFFNDGNHYLENKINIYNIKNIIKFISNDNEEKNVSSREDLLKLLIEILRNNLKKIKNIDCNNEIKSDINLLDVLEIKKIEVDII